MPTHTIVPCTVADGPALVRNNIPAFWQDDNWRFPWNHRTLEEQMAESEKRVARNLISAPETRRHQKAIDPETGRILGYARWELPESHATGVNGLPAWPEAVVPAVSPEEAAEFERLAETAVWNPNPALDGIEDEVGEEKKKVLAANSYINLDYLAVHPDNQGKGIASGLVQSGIDKARELGLDIFVLAFESGKGVYQRLGFQVDRDFKMDDSPFGGPGEYHFYFMTYQSPKPAAQ